MTCFKASGVYENSRGRTRGRRGAANELKLFEMAEDHLVQLHVSLTHQYWDYTYTVGWAAINRAYVEIMDDDMRLKERQDLQARVAKLEGQAKHSLLDLESDTGKLSLGGIGGGVMLAGTGNPGDCRLAEERKE